MRSRGSQFLLPVIVSCLTIWLLAMPTALYAAGTITVTTFDDEFDSSDSEHCSLREAIEAVNIHNDFGGCLLEGTAPFTIELAAGTYLLTREGTGEDFNKTGDFDILAPLLIRGAGADLTNIHGGSAPESALDRLFHIMPTADVTFAELTIENGAPETDGNGGAIFNMGIVTVNESILANNRAFGDEPGQGGGALYNGPNSIATLNNTTVTMNEAIVGLGNGGGIFNGPHASLTVNGGSIHQNTAARAGGGIENNGGTVLLNQSSLNNNFAGINGGGLHISSVGVVHMLGGEANGNRADAEGGALWNAANGTLTVKEATLTENSAGGADADQGGGALFSDGGTLTVINSTIMSNTADGAAGSGGGILAVMGSTLHIEGGRIVANRSTRAGGGIELNATNSPMIYATMEQVELANNVTGSAPGNGGALHITGPAHVTISDATVTNNSATAEGGGLWNSAVGTLTVINTTLSGNRATGDAADQGGGALFNDGGELTVINSKFINNRATGTSGSGGALLATVGSVLHMRGGVIAENSSMRAGGGIEINATAEMPVFATLDGIEFTGNTTGGAPGNGGALHITGPAQVHATAITANDNSATAEGGALWNSAVGTLTIVDSTFTGNRADGADADQGGGALFNDGGTMSLVNTTVTNNLATGAAGSGGALLVGPGSKVSVLNSDFRENNAQRAGGAIEIKGTVENTTTVDLRQINFVENMTGAAPGNGGALHITGQAIVLIEGGRATGNSAAAEGGAFWNSAVGMLTVNNVMLTGNSAGGTSADQGGGALFNDGGTMKVANAQLIENAAAGTAGSGGGILAGPGSLLEIRNSTIMSNTANRAGGAIEINGTVTDTVIATLDGVEMTMNSAGNAPGNGGALHITGAADVTVNGGLVRGNVAAAEGGGLWNSAVGTLTIDGTAILINRANGNDADQGGGGLFNDGGTLTVHNALIRGNIVDGTSGSGGGILNNQGTLAVYDSTIAGNQSNRAGGGIEDNAGVMSHLERVRLLKNSTGAAPGNGGALHITGAGTVEVIDSTIAENSATAEGGGLWNSAVGTLTVTGTTLNNNTTTASSNDGEAATQGGGALFNDGGTLTIGNSTLVGNSASNRNGGGLLNAAGNTTVVNVTIAQNADSGITAATGTVTLANTLVAFHDIDCVGAIATNGTPNLDSDGSCNASITADPMLGMPANNGGPSATLALLAGSAAIDAGDNASCAATPIMGVDQRGVSRPQGVACDLGAYEAVADNGGGNAQCANVPNNLVRNGSFEDGQNPWRFFTNSAGSFMVQSLTARDMSADCRTAAQVQVTQSGSNVQLYQRNLALEANTTYRLSFAAYATTERDLGVYLHDHDAPYTNYGLALNQVNLTAGWQRYTVEFTTKNFAGIVNNARLRFWLAHFAQGGDSYLIDDVRLEKRNGTESSLAPPTALDVQVSAHGITINVDASDFDPAILERVQDGNSVDDEPAILDTFLPLILQQSNE